MPANLGGASSVHWKSLSELAWASLRRKTFPPPEVSSARVQELQAALPTAGLTV